MRSNLKQKSEKGQSLVIIAVAMVGLLGFSAIAIDGGMLFADRRNAQNAADAASLAGAFALLQGGSPISPAFSRAADNAYDNNGVSNWVTVSYPPVSGPYTGDWSYVQVSIDSKIDSVFAHLVFGGELRNTVNAVAHAKPPTVEPLLFGNAIVGLARSGCAVVWSHGDNDTTISGSGIHVNSDHPDCAFKASGSNNLDVSGGAISVVGGFEISGGATVNPTPLTGAEVLETPVIPPPSCGSSGVRDDVAGTVSPGYIDDFDFHGGTWTLDSGIYCVDGGFAVNSGTVITGNDVTIYVMSGDISWNGGATINLDAPDDGEYAGLLLYQDPANTATATINGDSGSSFTGTMFIPEAEVQINGTGGADGFHSQVIGKTVDMSGTADLNIVYNDDENYYLREPAQVELTE